MYVYLDYVNQSGRLLNTPTMERAQAHRETPKRRPRSSEHSRQLVAPSLILPRDESTTDSPTQMEHKTLAQNHYCFHSHG